MKQARPKISLITFGCRTNKYDSAVMAENLSTLGETQNGAFERADLVIVNTCAVTHKPARDLRKLLGKISRHNGGKPVIITGCYSHLSLNEALSLPGVVAALTNDERSKVVEEAARALGKEPIPKAAYRESLMTPFAQTRPSVKIQDGCDTFCTFCIVPYARGRSRSRTRLEILEEVKRLAKNGALEIVLTGINAGAWGKDFYEAESLASLVEAVTEIPELARIRLSSIEPMEIDEPLLRQYAENPKLCPHSHIPLQSGSAKILRDMGRNYEQKEFAKIIERIRTARPDAAIGLDVIAGFPTETEEAFEESFEFIKSLDFTYLHAFTYSPREGTKAATIKPVCTNAQAAERTAKLIALSEDRKKTFADSQQGLERFIITERRKSAQKGEIYGVTDNYLTVKLTEGEPNLLVKARLLNYNGSYFIGEIV